MEIRFDFSELEKLQRNAEKVAEGEAVSLDVLMPPAFLRAHTPWASVDEMGEAAGIESADDPDARSKLDAAVAQFTRYSGLQDLIDLAAIARIKKQLAP
ncbi:MAG: hypothetical protein ACYC4L_09760 [Chloroflexota bacterium]